MDQDERRIRTLKLRGNDNTLLQKVRYRLEEAFRITSIRGIPPNAQLLVRRLDLGRIPADQSQVLLASRISEMLRNLMAAASCVDNSPATDADVVWFSDPLQAYKVLLLRLLDGNVLHEWYWHTLFPNQTLVLTSTTIEMIFSQAATTPLKGLAPARLLQELLLPRRLSRLFSCITEGLVRRLMHEQGVSLGAAGSFSPQIGERHLSPIQAVQPPNMSLPWRYAVHQAVECWGERDIRTLWFAWCGLIFHRPAWLKRKEVIQRIELGHWLESWALQGNGKVTREKTAYDLDTVIDGDIGRVTNEPVVLSVEDEGLVTRQLPAAPLTAEAGSLLASASRLLPDVQAKEFTFSYPTEVEQHTNDAEQVETTSSEDGRKEKGGDLSPSVVISWSAHAGLVFVIPLLQRLGMADLLESNERLLELDLPRQFLWSLVQRFGIAESDPLMPLFEGFEPSADGAIRRFCCPASWRGLVTASGRPLNACDIAGEIETIQFSEIIKIMQLLAGLYLHRYSALSLRGLIQRSGRVAMTATHWDVMFNINQIDLRLRRVALDSDPGWVAWLGRVVQFHYDSEGERYVP